MKTHYTLLVAIAACLISAASVNADPPSSFGSGFDVQEFYRAFTLDEIVPKNQQKWPYYKYVSAHWDKFAIHGTAKIKRSSKPAKLTVADKDERLDLNTEFKDGKSFIESLQSTQTKGFVIMKDNRILAEFYDNGFNVGDTNLLMSASKSYAGVITHRLIDEGKLDPAARVETYLKDFEGTAVGAATVQQVLDMTSGLPTLLNYHTPGAPGQLWEIELGLQPEIPIGHRTAIKKTKAVAKPGKAWNYTDMNTQVLALLADAVSGKKYTELLSELFDAFGANYDGSIALNSDKTASPCYGISTATRDFALFQQWIAQRKAPKSFYASVLDTSKTKFGENSVGKLLGAGITYGSQCYYLHEHDIIYSSGARGQVGFSDMRTGIAVVYHQDWAINVELEKFFSTREKALAIIYHLRAKSTPEFQDNR